MFSKTLILYDLFSDIGYGRLGNQLFQYAAARSLALHHNTKLCLGSLDNKSWHGQKCLLKYFNMIIMMVFMVPRVLL